MEKLTKSFREGMRNPGEACRKDDERKRKQLEDARKIEAVLLAGPGLIESPYGTLWPCGKCGRQTRKMARIEGRGKQTILRVCSLKCRNKIILDRFNRGILRPGHGVEPNPRFEVRATQPDGSVDPTWKDSQP